MKYLQKVKCKARLKRIHSSKICKDELYKSHFRDWRRIEIEFNGVIIGQRTLSNGQVEYDPEYIAFIPREYFKAYLVSVNMNENPVYVLPEDLEEFEEDFENGVIRWRTRYRKGTTHVQHAWMTWMQLLRCSMQMPAALQ